MQTASCPSLCSTGIKKSQARPQSPNASSQNALACQPQEQDYFQPTTATSAPEAPPETSTFPLSLTDLPQDALQKIVATLQSKQPLLDYLNLSSLKLVNKAFRDLIDPKTGPKTDPKHQDTNNINEYQRIRARLKTEAHYAYPLQQLFSTLATLPEQQRQQLIDFTQSLNNQSFKAKLYFQFAQHLHELTDHEKEQLIEQITQQKGGSDFWKSRSLKAFNAKLALLNNNQKDRLIHATSSLQNDSRPALRAFSRRDNLNLLNEEQKNQLINAVVNISTVYDKALAIRDFAKSLHLLNEAHKDQLIKATVSLKDYVWKDPVLSVFINQQHLLSPEQRQTLNQINDGDDFEIPLMD